MDTPQTPAPGPAVPPESEHTPTIAAQTVAENGAEAAPSAATPAAETAAEADATLQPSLAAPEPPDAPEPAGDHVPEAGAAALTEDAEALAEGDAESLEGEAGSSPFDPAVFDEALSRVLSSAGGEVLFRFAGDAAEGDKVAAVRLGEGEARLIALVILPPHGAPLRVEPAEESANPLAPLAKSYASLVDAWKAAA